MRTRINRILGSGLALWIAMGAGVPAFAAMSDEHALPWQMNFQEASSPVMERLTSLHDFLLVVITLITILVLALLAIICVRFNAKRNPVPSKTSHNTLLEIVWTTIPVMILVVVAVKTFGILFYMDEVPEADMTLKAVAHQWYWEYEYPDHGNIRFDSNMIEDKDIKPGQIRLLEVDNRIVLPVDTTVRLQLTSADVIHAFAIPSLGVKKDAVPGRLNETWFRATHTGTFRGQCSELCGIRHGFMPIVIDVVTKEEFNQWVEQAKLKYSSNAATTVTYAMQTAK